MHAADLITWAKANPFDAVGWAYVLLGLVNALMPHKGDEASGLRRLLDILAPLAPQKFKGSLKIPGMQSVPIADDEKPTNLNHPGPPTGPPAVLAVIFALAVPLGGCHLSHGTRAGVAFVGTVPSIEAGVSAYRAERPKLERAVADEADAACKASPTVAEFDACRDAIVAPKRKALDDVRLGVGSYAAAIVAVAKGQDGDLAAAAQKVIGLLGAIGIRVMQEVK